METDTEIPDIMTVTNLEVISGTKFTDFTIPATGLTLIHTGREQASTTLSMTLAGRMRPRRGRITITAPDGRAYRDDRRRFQHIALAGVPEIDSLERLVTVWAVIREQAAWHQPWWKPTPRSIDNIPSYTQAAELLGFTMTNDDATTLVGELDTLSRLVLRILLAIMARPDADLLIVDDIDQLRSMELRNKLLVKLRDYSQLKPVIATSVNPDFTYLCHNHVTLTTDTYQITAVNQ